MSTRDPKRALAVLSVGVIALLSFVHPVSTFAQIQIDTDVMDAGGGIASSATMELYDCLGQAIMGPMALGPTTVLTDGFLQTLGEPPPLPLFWAVDLEVTDSVGRIVQYRTFGEHEWATGGFDPDYDVVIPPPGFTFYSWLEGVAPFPYLSTSMKLYQDESVTWMLTVFNATGIDYAISWDPVEVPDGYTLFIDGQNMNTATQINRSGNGQFVIEASSLGLTITSVSPAPYAVGADPAAAISATFNRDVDPLSLSEESFVVRTDKRGRIPGAISYDIGSRTVTFQPDSSFLPGEEVNVVATSDAQSSEGIQLEPFWWSYLIESAPATALFSNAPMSPIELDARARHAVLGDMDGDRLLDMAVTDYPDQEIWLFKGTDAPAFTPLPDPWHPVTVSGNPECIIFCDVNEDEFLDIVVANTYGASATVLLGVDGSSFVEAPLSPFGLGIDPRSLVVADLDLDGHVDILASAWNWDTDDLAILFGDGVGGFTPAPYSPLELPNCDEPTRVSVGDFDSDGRPDVLLLEHVLGNPGYLHLLLSDGEGGYDAAPAGPFATTVLGPFDQVAGDFNGDGLVDVAIAGRESDAIEIVIGTGDGGFTGGSVESVSSYPRCIAKADLDGDGILDLATGSETDDDVTVLLGAGDGSFDPAPASPIAVGDEPCSIEFGDLGGDGDLDMIVGNFTSSNVSVLWNGDEAGGTGVDCSPPLSDELAVIGCHPNPFNPVTAVVFDCPKEVRVELSIYDVAGRHVLTLVDGVVERGRHRVPWNGTDSGGRHVTSGVYFARLQSSAESSTAKLVLLK